MTKRKRKKVLGWLAFACLLMWLAGGNLFLTISHVRVESEKLPPAFDGFTIALVSDLHNHPWGGRLTELLRRETPDLIAVSGDLIDSGRTKGNIALDFVREAVKIAPVYYVTGNHEKWAGNKADSLLAGLEAEGVHVLRNTWEAVVKDGGTIRIAGVDDPAFGGRGELENALHHTVDREGFTLLLSHRPELLPLYTEAGADLVLSGHAHGGQFRLPWLGGVIAPDQGLLPRYTAGLYHEQDTAMVVSRGLGNSVIPLRINNPPELVMITLAAAGEWE